MPLYFTSRGPLTFGLKMSREVIPEILKDAPRENLLISESFEFLFSLLGKSRHFSMQKSGFFHAYCILLCLGGDAARSELLHHPQHFVPAFLWLCISWFGFLCSWPLLGGSHSYDIHSEGDTASSNLFYQSHVVTCGDTSHGIYFAFSISTKFPGFCCDFS